MKKKLLILLYCLVIPFSRGQNIYKISAPIKEKAIYTGHLKMGGTNSNGGRIDVNSFYMTIDGKPFIPIMGEFHYSRYPNEQWEEEILKIKAGGVNVIPTYVFWNLHEEQEGIFNWTGDRNIRKFIELCKRHKMNAIVRIGPFSHGEIRNGGLPDWLFAKSLDVRSNDEHYLFYVKRLYGEIAKQLNGLYYKDGGPIIGIQIENEHQHSAAPWGVIYPGEKKDLTTSIYDSAIAKEGVSVQDKKIITSQLGDQHMKTLKKIAEEVGIITPLYTATGWGNAAVIGNEAIPVTAAYTYPFWGKPSMSPFCMFKDIQNEPDYAPVRYETDKFPSFCAEMGVGIQMIYKRRPIVSPEAAEALMVRTLGSGANGIGYYMYHGGSTPKMIGGVGSFNDEPMGMPKVSYDFQAPLGEFGLENDSYRALRLLHSFVADFGDRLAPMETVLPENYMEMTPANRISLRYAARMKDDSGFLFMVNFQDHDTARIDQKYLQLCLNLKNETIRIPAKGTFTLLKNESVILPFNFHMEDAVLKYATAQLMMKLDDRGVEHYVFFAPNGIVPEFMFDKHSIRGQNIYTPNPGLKSTFTIWTKKGKMVKITTLTRQQALASCKINGKLLITESTVLPKKDEVQLLSLGNNKFEYILYPSTEGLKIQTVSVPPVIPNFKVEKANMRRISVFFTDIEKPSYIKEYFLRLNYTADVAMAFLNGTLVLDQFYYGSPWIIGLNRFSEYMKKEGMIFYFRPLYSDSPFLTDLPKHTIPDFKKGPVCSIDKVEIIPEYTTKIKL